MSIEDKATAVNDRGSDFLQPFELQLQVIIQPSFTPQNFIGQ